MIDFQNNDLGTFYNRLGSRIRKREIKATVFIKDMNDFAAINEVYAEYFTAPFPARSCVEVARLPRDILVEVEVIAKKEAEEYPI